MNQSAIFASIQLLLCAFKRPQDEDVWTATLSLISGALSQAAVIHFNDLVGEVKVGTVTHFQYNREVDADVLWKELMEVSQ